MAVYYQQWFAHLFTLSLCFQLSAFASKSKTWKTYQTIKYGLPYIPVEFRKRGFVYFYWRASLTYCTINWVGPNNDRCGNFPSVGNSGHIWLTYGSYRADRKAHGFLSQFCRLWFLEFAPWWCVWESRNMNPELKLEPKTPKVNLVSPYSRIGKRQQRRRD
jgi:hypothetical protein